MLLIYIQKRTPRIDYVFKHVSTRILGIKVNFTSVIEEFIAFEGPKISYGKQPLGNELFFQASGLLQQQGFEDLEIHVKDWEGTKGFFSVSEKSALPFDIFSASFFLLSRYEEYLPHVKDDLGRYPASESLAYNHGFLKQPVVDIWAYRFQKVLQTAFPNILFPEKQFKVHNVVEAKRPYEFLQRGLVRNGIGFFADLWKLRLRRIFQRSKVLLHLRKDPFDTFKWMLNTAKNSKAALTVFFLFGEAFTFREDFNTSRERFKKLVKYICDYCEVGLVFSFRSIDDEQLMKQEKKQVEELTHRALESTFNDKQLIKFPHAYRKLIELEIARDFTMFYYDEIGFRAGTCTPFLFYDLDNEIKTPLIIHPVIGKSLSLVLANEKDVEGKLAEIFEEVKRVNGTFSFFLSNRDFVQTRQNKVWRYLFSDKWNTYE